MLVAVLVLALAMILVSAGHRLWWATGAAIAAVALASAKAWTYLDVLAGPPLVVSVLGVIAYFLMVRRAETR
jgi:hypothetical protein